MSRCITAIYWIHFFSSSSSGSSTSFFQHLHGSLLIWSHCCSVLEMWSASFGSKPWPEKLPARRRAALRGRTVYVEEGGMGERKKGKERDWVWWWVEARISAQPCLSWAGARSCGGGYWIQMRACLCAAAAATGGNALINTHCPSVTAARSVSLMIFRCPCPPCPPGAPGGAHWLMSGSQWYFHIDNSIDDAAPGTRLIEQLEKW